MTAVLVLMLGCSSVVRRPPERVALSDEDLTRLEDAASDVHVFPSHRIVVRYGEKTVAVPRTTSGRIIAQARVGEAAMLFVCFDDSCRGPDDSYRFTLASDNSYHLTRAPLKPSLPAPRISAEPQVILEAKKLTIRYDRYH